MRFFCPKCWSDFPTDVARCPNCGQDIPTLWRGKSYVEKLIAALNHPEPETSERAARLLGNLREELAVGDLIKLVSTTPNVYVGRAAVEALAEIGTPQARKFLASVAQNHKARMVREAARAGQMEKPKQAPANKSTPSFCVNLTLSDGIPRSFSDLVLDYSGTVSLEGSLLPGVAERFRELARSVRITVLTADTFEKAESQLKGLPVEVRIVRTGQEKADFMRELEPEHAIAIGNGRNDVPMMALAGLSVAVIGPEGAAGELLRVADIVVADIHHALDLIINPLRLKATLRD
jgi:soluble P-type ATPase